MRRSNRVVRNLMKVLVTGATGFVGKAIVSELLFRQNEVFAAGGPQSTSPLKSNLAGFFAIDVSNEDSFDKLERIIEVDAVIHAAGIAHRLVGHVHDSEYRKVNVAGVANIARLAGRLGAKQFILISSVLVYGKRRLDDEEIITEDHVCEPTDVYARSKLDGERKAVENCEQNNVKLTILRPAPIIGEGSRGNFARLIKAINRRRFIWVGDGSNLKSLVYVKDVAKAAVEILQKKSTKGIEIFNVAGNPVTMSDIVAAISGSLGKSVPPIRISPSILRKGLQLTRGVGLAAKSARIRNTLDTWLSQDVYSVDKLRKTYEFEAEMEITEAIRREIYWYRANK